MVTRSPAQPSSHGGTKIVPHITRPGTGCLRPGTGESLPVKISQVSGQCSLAGTRTHTPTAGEEASIRAVWTPGEITDCHPRACATKRIASCPSQLMAPCATAEPGEQAPKPPGCRTAPLHTLTTANRAQMGSRGLRPLSGLALDTMGTLKEHEPAGTADGGQQSPQLSSHPVSFNGYRTPHSSSQAVYNTSEGARIGQLVIVFCCCGMSIFCANVCLNMPENWLQEGPLDVSTLMQACMKTHLTETPRQQDREVVQQLPYALHILSANFTVLLMAPYLQ